MTMACRPRGAHLERMTDPRTLVLLAALLSLWACAPDPAVDGRLGWLAAQTEGEADAARACAEGLRRVVDRDPLAAASTLELLSSATYLPIPGLSGGALAQETAVERARAEIARREETIRADRRALEEARGSGPGALDRALAAALQARRARERLCRARDAAAALTAFHARQRAQAGASASAR